MRAIPPTSDAGNSFAELPDRHRWGIGSLMVHERIACKNPGANDEYGNGREKPGSFGIEDPEVEEGLHHRSGGALLLNSLKDQGTDVVRNWQGGKPAGIGVGQDQDFPVAQIHHRIVADDDGLGGCPCYFEIGSSPRGQTPRTVSRRGAENRSI